MLSNSLLYSRNVFVPCTRLNPTLNNVNDDDDDDDDDQVNLDQFAWFGTA